MPMHFSFRTIYISAFNIKKMFENRQNSKSRQGLFLASSNFGEGYFWNRQISER